MQRAKALLMVSAGIFLLTLAYHPVRALQLELDSGNISSGGTYAHTFNAAGAYPYHCLIHPNMQASVTVSVGSPPSASVSMVGLAFNPSSVTVAPGGTVLWTNNDAVTHTVTSDTPTLARRGTWARLKALYLQRRPS